MNQALPATQQTMLKQVGNETRHLRIQLHHADQQDQSHQGGRKLLLVHQELQTLDQMTQMP
jgi:hypothetical protein